jgi:hypothetical protein
MRGTKRQPTRAQRDADLLAMMRADPRVAKVYQDSDGWWAECANGYRNGQDPIAVLHGAVEDTLPALADAVLMFRRCDCAECKARG